VLIIGAGPVGLVLAIELRTAGAHAVVLERLTAPDTRQKARGVGVLGSEALRRRGLADRLQRDDDNGRRGYRHDMGSDRGHFAWIAKLDSLRGHRVTGLRQDETSVHVDVEAPDGGREFTARYVVGCDGGQSSVRKLAGFGFPGIDSTTLTRVARLTPVDPTAFPDPVRTAHGTLQHPGIRDGWVRVRLSEPESASAVAHDRSPVTVAEIHDVLERVTGIDIALADVREGRRVRNSSRQAATYRMGRILLAGDAAHVHSPIGGQGLNLGITDAVNLGWKLAAVVRGTVHHDLLDSYNHERHPVGERVITNTRAQEALLEPTPQVAALREIMSDLMDLPEVQRYLGGLLSGVDVRHRLPYTVDTKHELLGAYMPDFVVDSTTLYTLMSDARPLLLHTSQAAETVQVAEAWNDRLRVISTQVLGQRDLTALLVRPDGVLAWIATAAAPPDLTSLENALRVWFGQPRRDNSDDQ
jgi:2-polyprenyl-6-methoxyphenol hydroxylase-like FAD-dependent oxidoreductase